MRDAARDAMAWDPAQQLQAEKLSRVSPAKPPLLTLRTGTGCHSSSWLHSRAEGNAAAWAKLVAAPGTA